MLRSALGVKSVARATDALPSRFFIVRASTGQVETSAAPALSTFKVNAPIGPAQFAAVDST